MPKDYYKILGVDKNASDTDIKKAFSKLAHKYHPDKKGGDEAKFKEINEAYQVLKNKEKRRKYDQFGTADFASGFSGANPFEGGFSGGSWQDFAQDLGGTKGVHFDFSDIGNIGDIFGDFFSGSRGTRQRTKFRGNDLQTEMSVSFEEAVFGTEKIINLKKNIICDECNGKGGIGTKICPKCNGSGQVRIQQNTIFGSFQSVSQCQDCNGTGQVIKDICGKCKGQGFVLGTDKIKIKIPAGVDDNQSLRLSGKGEAGIKGGTAGDLFINIRVQKSRKFEREGYNIKSTVKVKYSQLIQGDKIKVETVDGLVNLKVPAFTSSGKVFILRSKGVHKLHARGRGDHLVTVKLSMPDSLTKEQKKLISDLEKSGL